MTKEEYWAAHVQKNPRFKDEEARIEIKVGMLRKLLEDAYDKGAAHAGAKAGSSFLDDVLKLMTPK